MFELWDGVSRNMIDSYASAIVAEEYLLHIVREHGSSALRPFVLSYEGENEQDDALIGEGEAMLVAIKRLAAAERENASHATGSDRRAG